jgi:hypothetical protein
MILFIRTFISYLSALKSSASVMFCGIGRFSVSGKINEVNAPTIPQIPNIKNGKGFQPISPFHIRQYRNR